MFSEFRVSGSPLLQGVAVRAASAALFCAALWLMIAVTLR